MLELLKSSDVQHFEPQVVHQLVECMHQFTSQIIKDAHDYALHAGRKTTEVDDLKVALQSREQALTMPSRDAMMDLAQEVNKKDIPPIIGSAGIRLPPAQFQSTNRPFRVAKEAPSRQPFSSAASSAAAAAAASSSSAPAASSSAGSASSSSAAAPSQRKGGTGGRKMGKQILVLAPGIRVPGEGGSS
mmetsp:Transcript_16586/g.38772  ORF Transcript_16586/g.38772 Transcript_16586/m.38772 type:complete len:188 (-) Transcript_16586:149-712(-)